MERKVKSIFISDVHLGTKVSKPNYLLKFLKDFDSENIFLIGDIIDFWRLNQRPYWPQEHNTVIQKLLKKSRLGKKIIYIPGNHDEFLRQYDNLNLGGIEIKLFYEYQIKDKRFILIHGDQFDLYVLKFKKIAKIGGIFYDLSQNFNYYLNKIRYFFGLPYWSLSGYLKRKIKNASNFIENFESILIDFAVNKNYDGVICGHIHQGNIKVINNVIYANCSDWCDSIGGLIETYDGELIFIQNEKDRWVEKIKLKI
ncbi:MAG: UDP-2,3-diacylglucosamine diphosphatase [Candidatus Dojkabacteria bacterium]|nr:UDP-2,3-diacylglucosamine diphosphatase [Candidatus Dojkabacteria bacterium]